MIIIITIETLAFAGIVFHIYKKIKRKPKFEHRLNMFKRMGEESWFIHHKKMSDISGYVLHREYVLQKLCGAIATWNVKLLSEKSFVLKYQSDFYTLDFSNYKLKQRFERGYLWHPTGIRLIYPDGELEIYAEDIFDILKRFPQTHFRRILERLYHQYKRI